ncbi:MAG: acyl-CoA dehydrogenase family protein [Hyphomonas sp.]
MKSSGAVRGETFRNPDAKVWLERMAAKGWTAPQWPKKYGGGGLSRTEDKVLQEEMRRIRARPPLFSFDLWMFGPALLEFGNEEQKQRFIPDIIHGRTRWCQGYSEPGAGSDLADLQTRCEDKGDHYLINGQKVWTSYADKADGSFASCAPIPASSMKGCHPVRYDIARCRGAADQLISGEKPVLRNLLHRCEGAEGPVGRRAEWRLGNCQTPPSVRALVHLGRRLWRHGRLRAF